MQGLIMVFVLGSCLILFTHNVFFQLNFNEAVNFALPDWLPFGLACVERYREHRKLPVFSHDELVLTIAQHSTGIKTAMW